MVGRLPWRVEQPTPGQIVEGDTGDNGDVTLDQLSDTNKTPIADAEEVSTQEPYIVSLDDIPADLLGAFEYGYSTVHSEKPDLDEAERLEMELDLIRQWCDSFVIAIPDNLNEVYPEWHAQYEAALNAIDEGGNTQSGSNTGTNSGTQPGTVDDITPPSNNNSNSSGGNTGNTSKPSTGSSNNSSGTSSGSSSSGSNNSNESTPPSDADLEAAFGVPPAEMDPSSGEGVADGSRHLPRPRGPETGWRTGHDIVVNYTIAHLIVLINPFYYNSPKPGG